MDKREQKTTLIFRGFNLDEVKLSDHLYRCITDDPLGKISRIFSDGFRAEKVLAEGWWTLDPLNPELNKLHRLWDELPLASGVFAENRLHEKVIYPVTDGEKAKELISKLRRNFPITIAYRGFKRQGKISSTHGWGIRLKTTDGFRNFSWDHLLLLKGDDFAESRPVTVIMLNKVNQLGFGTLNFWIPTKEGLRPTKTTPYDSRLSYRIVVAGSRMIYAGVAGN